MSDSYDPVDCSLHSINSVYVSIPIFQFFSLSFPSWYPYLCSLGLCLYFCFSNKIMPFFYISHILCDSCFSLSDLLHSVWRCLDPSTFLQMTLFHSFFIADICTTYFSFFFFLSFKYKYFNNYLVLIWYIINRHNSHEQRTLIANNLRP